MTFDATGAMTLFSMPPYAPSPNARVRRLKDPDRLCETEYLYLYEMLQTVPYDDEAARMCAIVADWARQVAANLRGEENDLLDYGPQETPRWRRLPAPYRLGVTEYLCIYDMLTTVLPGVAADEQDQCAVDLCDGIISTADEVAANLRGEADDLLDDEEPAWD